MPKTSKTTKKPLRRWNKIFRPNSPKRALLLFIVSFALVGGYFVYKSFAASTWTQNANSINPIFLAERGTDNNGTNKGTIPVIRLNSAPNSLDIGGIADSGVYLSNEFSTPRQARMCVWARTQVIGTAGNADIWLNIVWSNIDSKNGSIGTNAKIEESTAYQYKCTNFVWAGGGPRNSIVSLKRLGSAEGTYNAIYISSITLEWL